MKNFLNNLEVLHTIIRDTKSGVVRIAGNQQEKEFYVYRAVLANPDEKSTLFHLLKNIDTIKITFEQKQTVPLNANGEYFPLMQFLWLLAHETAPFLMNEAYDSYIKDNTLVKGDVIQLPKLSNLDATTLLVSIFFSKNKNRTFNDLATFYHYKDKNTLLLKVYLLFFIGNLKILHTEQEQKNELSEQIENKNLLLQKLFNKVRSLK